MKKKLGEKKKDGREKKNKGGGGKLEHKCELGDSNKGPRGALNGY